MDNALRLKSAKIAFWCYVALSFFISMILPLELVEEGPYRMVTGLVGAFCIFMCIHYDSQVVGRKLGPLFKIGVIFLAIIFVPVYIYQTRGFMRGTVALLKHIFIVFGIIFILALIFVGLEFLGLIGPPA